MNGALQIALLSGRAIPYYLFPAFHLFPLAHPVTHAVILTYRLHHLTAIADAAGWNSQFQSLESVGSGV